VTDCANVAVARYFHIPTIFSFDKVYPKSFGLKLASA
jgi:predicted nucleic acid-binding protein